MYLCGSIFIVRLISQQVQAAEEAPEEPNPSRSRLALNVSSRKTALKILNQRNPVLLKKVKGIPSPNLEGNMWRWERAFLKQEAEVTDLI